jgi:hypothetical protein
VLKVIQVKGITLYCTDLWVVAWKHKEGPWIEKGGGDDVGVDASDGSGEVWETGSGI